jgi:hypothetical protein
LDSWVFSLFLRLNRKVQRMFFQEKENNFENAWGLIS